MQPHPISSPNPSTPAVSSAAIQALTALAAHDADFQLDPQALVHLAEVAEVQVLAPGQVLFEEGAPSDAVYLVISGDVAITQAGKETASSRLHTSGEFIGEMGVVENQPRSATARAYNQVQVLRFTTAAFLSIVSTAPFLVWKLMRNFSARLRQREREYLVDLQKRNQELAEAAAHLEQLVAERTRDLAAANGRLEALSVTDDLTGIYNRRFLHQILDRMAADLRPTTPPFAVIMVDVDYFKHYNDRNGHLAGDNVLRDVGDLLNRSIRSTDILARYGGEEFCIVLESTRKADAQRVAGQLCQAIRERPFPHGAAQPLGALTASFGVAAFPDDAQEVLAVVAAADGALYQAKQGGRNQVRAASPETDPTAH